ncbi:MAG: hypothetical protein CMK83_17195 [Pseudomonadales bacterium]|jgi:hypothetical protein|uniref:MAPEG family protein n=1 Tax=unclassified Ketobacter TaxID=2639109 RepID=UPI000C39D7E9|nr:MULTISPECIES: MAPEG family protein [unclassified Ketobacter]MAQ25943.1 hypothetical protein [Pseudomonadales bacterium]MEC8813258.1 MAPEG family protein [Pseudomonadota bacterium]TNC89341.1 MAG: hypothetical protein CSH49_07580 [Alcanivorax sp.]HAG94564.1 hypothetical protein [Gammaproteobacteria bacterium]MBI27323.1 hypothetical protein [Pseudomonadales bacterium]|tara:strand:- start:616 stop:1035 length:420 start_codon:yes stop_codon:yes gene_type:complete
MNEKMIFLPVLIHILLTLSVFIALASAKKKALQEGGVNEDRRGLFDDAWPNKVIQINNNIRNQFELPVLFYILIFMLWELGGVNSVAVIVAWLFVISRMLHAYIHTGTNYVPLRRKVFMFGALMVLALSVLVSKALFSG